LLSLRLEKKFETNLDYMAKVHFMEGEVDAVDEEINKLKYYD